MPLPRFRLRTLMIAVAAAGLLLESSRRRALFLDDYLQVLSMGALLLFLVKHPPRRLHPIANFVLVVCAVGLCLLWNPYIAMNR